MPVVTDTKEVKGMTAGVHIQDSGKFICSCGHEERINYRNVRECPDCKTPKIATVDTLNKKGRVRVDSILTVISKDDREFHIEKKELYVYIDEETETARLKVGKHFEMMWSLKTRTLEVYRNKKLVENEERYSSFFRGITHEEVLNTVSTEGNRQLLKFAFEKLGKINDERNESLTRALTRLFDYPKFELFAFSGFGKQLDNIWNVWDWKRSTATKPNEILGVPKYMMPFLKKLGNLDSYKVQSWKRMDEAFGGNNVKMMLEMMDDENSVDNFHNLEGAYFELVKTYGYNNHKNLMKYLTREIKLHQGITSAVDGARTLRDYVRMCRDMKINPEKYSKNLKKDHDIAAMNYRMLQDMQKKEAFIKEMTKTVWDEIVYANKEYTIVRPLDPQELVTEGETLGHCVASYVDDVIKGTCKVLFMRLLATPEDGLITVEVRGEENLRVVQVKGRGNRLPNAKEKEFIKEWVEKKNKEWDKAESDTKLTIDTEDMTK